MLASEPEGISQYALKTFLRIGPLKLADFNRAADEQDMKRPVFKELEPIAYKFWDKYGNTTYGYRGCSIVRIVTKRRSLIECQRCNGLVRVIHNNGSYELYTQKNRQAVGEKQLFYTNGC